MESQRISEPVPHRRSFAFGDHSYCRKLLVRSARFPRIITSPLFFAGRAQGQKSKLKASLAAHHSTRLLFGFFQPASVSRLSISVRHAIRVESKEVEEPEETDVPNVHGRWP